MFSRRLLVAVSVTVFTFLALFNAQPASAGTEFNGLINGLRASKGVPALQESGQLNAVAQDWANQMAARGAISHRPSLTGAVGGGFSKLGENVGTGGSAGVIFGALSKSPGHYRNMVDATFTHVGTGVARGADGRLYTAHNFGAIPGARAAAPAAASAKRAATPQRAATPKASRGTAPRQAAPAAAPAASAPAAPTPADAPVAGAEAAPQEEVAPPPPPPASLEFGRHEVAGISVQG